MADPIRRLISVVFDKSSAKKVEGELVRSLESAGQKGGDNFIRELRARFASRMASLREELASGIIDKNEFRKQSEVAAKAFNTGLLSSIKKARDEGKLTDAEYVKLTRNLKQVGDTGASAWDKIKGRIIAAGSALAAAFAVRRLVQFGRDSMEAAAEAEASWNRLEGSLNNVGESMERVGGEVRRLARDMQDTTVVGDEDFAEVLATLVQISGSYEKSLRNVSVVADLASAKHMDLNTAAQIVGKAMVGVTSTLKRFGIIVKEGDDAVEVMREQFAGFAAREGKTMEGQLARLNNEWGDFKEELGQALIDSSNGASIVEKLADMVKYLATNMSDLLALIVNLTKAIVVTGALVALKRLTTAVGAANVATTGLIATFRAGMAAIGPAGWFLLAVTVLTTAFQKLGQAQRDAAQAQADYLESLPTKTGAQLDAEYTRLMAEYARAKALYEDLKKNTTNLNRPSKAFTDAKAEVDRLDALVLAVVRARNTLLNATLPDLPEVDEEALTKEVALLKEAADLNVLGEQGARRALDLQRATTRALQDGTLSMQRRVDLTKRLIDLEGITGIRSIVPGMSARGAPAAPVLTPNASGRQSLSFLRPGSSVVSPLKLPKPDASAVSEWDKLLVHMETQTSTVAMYMENSFAGFFSALLTGFDETKEGFHSLADAAVGVGGAVAAGLASGLADYYRAHGAAKIAESIWPINPAGLVSGAGMIAAAGLLDVVAGGASHAGVRAGVPGAAPREVGRRATDSSTRAPGDVIVYINPLNPTDPAYQRNVKQATDFATDRFGGRKVTVKPYPRKVG